MAREPDHRKMGKGHTAAVVALRLLPRAGNYLGGVAFRLELTVGKHMNRREGKFEPNPVRAVYSIREDVTIENKNVMRGNVAIGVNDSIDTRRLCSAISLKTLCHGGPLLCFFIRSLEPNAGLS